MYSNKKIGYLGEKIAKKFLTSKGFHILKENFFTPFGEIDLITKKNNMIIFIEVKTKQEPIFLCPLLSITKTKQNHILKNCLYTIKFYKLYNYSWRIDAIGITLDNKLKTKTIKHVKNICKI